MSDRTLNVSSPGPRGIRGQVISVLAAIISAFSVTAGAPADLLFDAPNPSGPPGTHTDPPHYVGHTVQEEEFGFHSDPKLPGDAGDIGGDPLHLDGRDLGGSVFGGGFELPALGVVDLGRSVMALSEIGVSPSSFGTVLEPPALSPVLVVSGSASGAIPVPGVLPLLGVAALVGGRRRRRR